MRPEVKVLLPRDGQVAGEGAGGPTGRVTSQRHTARRYPAGGVRDTTNTTASEQVRRGHGPRFVRAGQPVHVVQIPARDGSCQSCFSVFPPPLSAENIGRCLMVMFSFMEINYFYIVSVKTQREINKFNTYIRAGSGRYLYTVPIGL